MHTRLLMLPQMGLSVWFLKIEIVNSSWWYGNIRRGVSKQMSLHFSSTNYICRCTYMVTVNYPLVRGYYLWISGFSKVDQLQLNLWPQVSIQKYEHPTEHWLIQEIWNKWQGIYGCLLRRQWHIPFYKSNINGAVTSSSILWTLHYSAPYYNHILCPIQRSVFPPILLNISKRTDICLLSYLHGSIAQVPYFPYS
jgi:hypothetical protein